MNSLINLLGVKYTPMGELSHLHNMYPRYKTAEEVIISVKRIGESDLKWSDAGMEELMASDARKLISKARGEGWTPYFYLWPDMVCGVLDVNLPDHLLFRFYNHWRQFAELESVNSFGSA